VLRSTSELTSVCFVELAEEDQDGEEGAGPLTQLLGPDRHTALELKKAGIKWKTKQKEGSVPGQDYTAVWKVSCNDKTPL